MNIDFLQQQAKKNNKELHTLQHELDTIVYNYNPDTKGTLLSTLTTGIFVGTVFTPFIRINQWSITSASGMNVAYSYWKWYQDQKTHQKVARLRLQIDQKNACIDTAIQHAYTEYKNGNQKALAQLVELSGKEAVEEVEPLMHLNGTAPEDVVLMK